MTTPDRAAKQPETGGRFVLPDPPERESDDMTSAEHLSETGLHHHLKQFLGNPETTIAPIYRQMTPLTAPHPRHLSFRGSAPSPSVDSG